MKNSILHIEEYLTRLETHQRFAGTVLAAKDGKIIFHNGYGKANLEHDVGNDTSTIFRIGSITKPFTAIAILQLVEQGKISLHEPIFSYFPSQTGSEIITLHHLLTHSSGIYDYINGMLEPELKSWIASDWSQSDVLSLFSNKPLAFEPGKHFSYSNSGYYLLGMIIEQVTGLSLGAYFSQYIFLPSNMPNTSMDDPTSIVMHRAVGNEESQDDQLLSAPYVNMNYTFAAGAILTTTWDLFHWQSTLRSNILISEQSRQLMQTSHISATDCYYGYGWLTQKTPYGQLVGSSGGIFGFRSIFLDYVDADLTVIVLSNLFKPVDEIGRHITGIILR